MKKDVAPKTSDGVIWTMPTAVNSGWLRENPRCQSKIPVNPTDFSQAEF
jgi:hypothetical protein